MDLLKHLKQVCHDDREGFLIESGAEGADKLCMSIAKHKFQQKRDLTYVSQWLRDGIKHGIIETSRNGWLKLIDDVYEEVVNQYRRDGILLPQGQGESSKSADIDKRETNIEEAELRGGSD